MRTLLTLLALTLILPFNQAWAARASATIAVKVHLSEAIYHSADGEPGVYNLVDSTIVSDQKISGTGILREISSNERNKTQKMRPGVEFVGHNKIKLTKVSESEVAITVDANMTITEEGVSSTVTMNYTAPAVFKEGSFTAYENGETVQIVLTKEGQKIASQANVAAIERVLEELRQEIAYQLPLDSSSLKLDKVKIGTGVLTGTKYQMLLQEKGQYAKVTLKVSGSW